MTSDITYFNLGGHQTGSVSGYVGMTYGRTASSEMYGLVLMEPTKFLEESADMSFIAMYATPEGIVAGADTLVLKYTGTHGHMHKIFSVLDGKAVIVIAGQMTYGDSHKPFSEIINGIKATTVSSFISKMYDTMKREPVKICTDIFIAGYDNAKLVTGHIGGNEGWSVRSIKANTPTYSGAYWATHYAASCSFPTYDIEGMKNHIHTLITKICEVDKALDFIDNTVGGNAEIITVYP